LSPVGRQYDGRAYSNAKSISHWLEYMEQNLVKVLIDKQEAAHSAALNGFAASLREGDTVATFNFDTLLECALATRGTTWSHGFPSEHAGAVTVLKLHGSVDW